MKRKLIVVIVTLIIILIGGYYYGKENMQYQGDVSPEKVTSAKWGLPNKDTAEKWEPPTKSGPTTNEIELKSQLEDLDEQLINTRAELKLTQEKLILANSKNTILEKDLEDARDTLETLQKVLERLSE